MKIITIALLFQFLLSCWPKVNIITLLMVSISRKALEISGFLRIVHTATQGIKPQLLIFSMRLK